MDEQSRLRILHSFAVLDTPAEREYDDIVELAAAICDVPIALISLVDRDRQWFKARVGLPVQETPRELAFCAHALQGQDVLVVPDATADARFADNALVTGEPHIRFYLGVPLVTEEGAALGTLCVIDRQPRQLSPAQVRALEVLARQATLQLEYRRKAAELARHLIAREESERARKEDRELAGLIVEQSGDGIVVADEQGRIVLFNPAAQRQHGVGSAGAAAETWATTYGLERRDGTPLPLAETPLYLAVRGERVENARWRVRRPDGSVRLLEGSAWPLHRANGQPRGGVLITRDVTDAVRAEEALKASEAQARALYEAERRARADAEQARQSQEQVLAVVSHDLRNPLNAIVMSASLLRSAQRDAAAAETRYADVILRASAHMTRLIADLLDMAAIDAGRLTLERADVPVCELLREVQEIMTPLAAARPLQLEVERCDEQLTARIDRARMTQVLSNLVGNAIKFTPPHGQVRVSARAAGDGVEMRVIDTGPGLDPAQLPRVFDRFWKGSGDARGGVGLGLWIAKAFVDAHGGRIDVVSQPGEGATFRVVIPHTP